MKRSVVIGVTALIAGMLLAITAVAAPFRDYRQAAADQYTTSTPTTTVGVTVTAGVTTPVTGADTGTPTTPTDDGGGVAPDDATGQGDPAGDEDDGSGAAPAQDDGAGTGAPGTQAPRGAGAGAGDGRGTVALLTVGPPSTKLGQTILAQIGLPAWGADAADLDVNALGDAAAGTPFAGIGEGDLDMDKLRGLATRIGGQAVVAEGLSVRLPDLLSSFQGTVKPITGIVLTHSKLADEDDQDIAEAFVRSFSQGAIKADIPVVGVELEDTTPSSVSFFKKIKGGSSVNDLDTAAGATSLQRLLGGAKPGHYGTGDDTDGATAPAISPDPASATVLDGGGSLSGSPLLVGLLLTMALLAGRALYTVTQRGRRA